MSVKALSNVKPIDPCEEFAQHGVYQSNQCRDNLVASVARTNSCFPPALVNLIMQHLPPIAPKTRNWETEWTGPSLGRDVVWFTLNNACVALSDNGACRAFAQEELVTEHQVTGKSETHQFILRRERSCLDIINDYLEKGNKFGAERIEKAYGRERIFQLCPKYNPDYPLPVEIDDLMQTPLRDRFTHPDALVGLPEHVTRMTHLIGLYLKPQGMTASISQELVRPCGTQFHEYSWQEAIADDDNTPTKTTEWRWYGEFVLGRGKSCAIQFALIPAGLEPTVPSDTFCEFTHFACTGSWTLPEGTWNRTSKIFEELRVAFGSAGVGGLYVYYCYDDAALVYYGVVPSGSS
jgi:hypothetical protein